MQVTLQEILSYGYKERSCLIFVVDGLSRVFSKSSWHIQLITAIEHVCPIKLYLYHHHHHHHGHM